MNAKSRDIRRGVPLPEPESTATKRAASLLSSHRQKRIYSPPIEPDRRFGQLTEGTHHVRWLIESPVCARVLGPSGKRLKYMKDSTKESTIQARISTKTHEADYRIFSCTGSAISVSKIVGLVVRYIYDEAEGEHSGPNSHRYDFKLLIPQIYVDKLSGTNEENLREIEERSNATLSFEQNCLPSSDEKCLHIYGVADAVQIAVYYTLETMKRAESALKVPLQGFRVKQLDPTNFNFTKLEFKAGRLSDNIPRLRSGSVNSNAPNKSESVGKSNQGNASTEDHNSDTIATLYGKKSPKNHTDVSHKLEFPVLEEISSIPQSVYTAYEIAKDSQRSHLRQVVQIDSAYKGTDVRKSTLIDDIKRVTDCTVAEGLYGPVDHFSDDLHSNGGLSLIIEGPPEENSLALLLIYRFLKKQSQQAA